MKISIRKSIKRAAALAAAVIILASLFSCGVTYDESEIKAAAAELIEASYDINVIYFGEGLPTAETPDDYVMKHLEIAEDSPYHTEEEIKEATLAVYSESYSNFLFEKAFSGFSVDLGDEDSVDSAEIIDARYVEYGGRLVVLPIDEEDVMKLDRTYDTDKIEVIKQRNGNVTIRVPSYVDGKAEGDVTLTVVKTDAGWRLDTPTY